MQEVIFQALCALESLNTSDTIIIIKPHLALPASEECRGGEVGLIPNLIKNLFCSSSQSHLPF